MGYFCESILFCMFSVCLFHMYDCLPQQCNIKNLFFLLMIYFWHKVLPSELKGQQDLTKLEKIWNDLVSTIWIKLTRQNDPVWKNFWLSWTKNSNVMSKTTFTFNLLKWSHGWFKHFSWHHIATMKDYLDRYCGKSSKSGKSIVQF